MAPIESAAKRCLNARSRHAIFTFVTCGVSAFLFDTRLSPFAFARKHSYPVGVKELKAKVLTPGLDRKEYDHHMERLQEAYEDDIYKWGHRRDWARALTYFQDMQDNEFPLNEHVYIQAIRACADKVKAQWHRSLNLLREMEANQFRPNAEAFKWAMKGCAKARENKIAINLFREMVGRKRRLKPDEETYSDTLKLCRTAGYWEDAIAIIEAIDRTDYEPSGKHFNLAMAACIQADEERWFGIMEDKAAARGYESEI
eukprot:TRINITY_DN7488_c0_g4_i1.p1 TRINITY_DN7488_c0_g4~~TRINITY_DN7488_c0_g4_i1.p1  ORF type:complete len:257 (+),score=37.83 TRINITY_DN7488_c0_g4_i1:79-849(+)